MYTCQLKAHAECTTPVGAAVPSAATYNMMMQSILAKMVSDGEFVSQSTWRTLVMGAALRMDASCTEVSEVLQKAKDDPDVWLEDPLLFMPVALRYAQETENVDAAVRILGCIRVCL